MTNESLERINKRKNLKKTNQRVENGSIFFDLPKGLVVLTFMMISVQVLLSNIVGVKGAELVTLEENKNKLLHEKLVLENEISKFSSLIRIEQVSREKLGMKQGESNISYIDHLYVADAR